MPRRVLFLVLGWLPALALAEPAPIVLDGLMEDWADLAPVYEDPSGDGSGVDFGRIWVADDPDFLFLRFETGQELQLDENNSIVLYLDTDASSATGYPVGGIGAELVWELGNRTGEFYPGGGSVPVGHAEIRFRGMPTVSATDFEVAVGRNVRPDGQHPLFAGTHIRILLRDLGGGDQAPDAGQLLDYDLDQGPPPADEPIPLEPMGDDLRLVTQNVKNDGPWTGDGSRFGRLLRAVGPRIVAYQEIYNHSVQDVVDFVASWVAPGPGESWWGAGNADCKTVSLFPILGSWPLDGNVATLLETTDALGTPMLLINAHFPCCSDEEGRQREVDRILAFIRDAREPGGDLYLPQNTPIVITGDLNLVGEAATLENLLTGNIQDEANFGPDVDPDADGTALTRTYWRQTELRMGYTWRNDFSSYWPGQLDEVIYTDAVLELRRHYVLYTPEMSPDTLGAHGLQSGDSEASDHLLAVADLRSLVPGTTDVEWSPDKPLRLLGMRPGAVLPRLRARLEDPAELTVDLVDVGGRHLVSPRRLALEAGEHEFSLAEVFPGLRPAGGGVLFLRWRLRGAVTERRGCFKWVRLP
jgi:endonuclease/exonuclease/phosphatase family metal-dependent hydrolase